MLFDADPDHIATLDSVTLVKLMKRLMLAECRSTGIPLRGAAAPLQITVPDGGEDGRVEWTGGEPATGYFPHRFTLFQSKAQNLTEARVKEEILKKSRGRKAVAKLSPAILEVLSKRGAYIIFCSKPLVTSTRKKFVKDIKAAIKAGGENPKKAAAIEVYDANLIADWINTHPSVALWLASQRLGRPLHGFQTHEGWGRSPDIHMVPWKSGNTPRFTPINRSVPLSERVNPDRASWNFDQVVVAIHEFLANERTAIRISGPSGFGKSRFVFEALGPTKNIADEVDTNSVIYADGTLSGNEAIKLALEMADTAQAAILVIDECDDDLHNKLALMVQRDKSRLRLVTIDTETKVLRARETLTIQVDKTDDENIREIAKGIAPKLSHADSHFISELAEGFPRMAVLAAQENGGVHGALESAAQVLDRVIWGSKSHLADAQKVLEIASIFDWIGIQGRVENQVQYVATELAGMSAAVFVEHLLSFRNRGIVTQRGDFAQVGPVPLAARLGLHRLSLLTAEHLLTFFERASNDLKASLLNRLKWLDTSDTAQAFVRRLLEPALLGNLATLNTKFGSKCLDRLAHIEPDVVASTVERLFGGLSFDELRALRDGRRFLVYTLEKLVFREQSFPRAARLLRRLAVAENETWGNNATGEFKRLFTLHLSGTQAGPAARLLVLDEGLASEDASERQICVDALDEMLTTHHFSRSGGAEQIGSAEPLEDWSPKTYGEIWDFYRAAIERLTKIVTSGDPLAAKAKQILSSHIRGLIHQVPFKDIERMIDTVTACCGFWPEALSSLSEWLFFDRKEARPEAAKEVRALFDRLVPSDPIQQAVLYTRGWQGDLHHPDTDYDPNGKHDFDYSTRQASRVAETIAKHDHLARQAVERLACSDAQSVFAFARTLAVSVPDVEALFAFAVQVAEAAAAAPNRQFYAGLISGASNKDPRLAKKMVRVALKSPRLKAEAISLIGSGPLQQDDIELVVSLLRSKDIQPWQCASITYHLKPELFLPLLEELRNHGAEGLWTIIDIIGMYFHDKTSQPLKQLLKILKNVLLAPELLERTRRNTDGYHLEQSVSKLAKLGEITPSYARSLAKQLLRICGKRSDNIFYELDDPVRKSLSTLMSLHPNEVWSQIAKVISHKSWHIRFQAEHLLASTYRDDHLQRGLSVDVSTEIYLSWVRENPAKRAAVAVQWLRMANMSDDGLLHWDREAEDFVKEFGNEPDVLSAMSRRIHPTSWSGSLAARLEPIVPLLESWRVHPNAKVRRWVEDQIEWFHKTIAHERKRDEEDDVRFS